MRSLLLLSLFLALHPGNATAQETCPAHYLSEGEAVYVEKGSGRQRSRTHFTFSRENAEGRIRYTLDRYGEGSFGRFDNVHWHAHAQLEEREGFLSPLRTEITIRDRNNALVSRYEKEFDYAAQEIRWIGYGPQGSAVKKASFPLKGRTADDITLPHFLKPYAARAGDPQYASFYLITNEPRLYKTDITPLGTATLSLPFGDIPAVKLKLTGDMGIMDEILDRYVPATYLWYEAGTDHDWLQYEGFETGFGSTGVVARLTRQKKKCLTP